MPRVFPPRLSAATWIDRSYTRFRKPMRIQRLPLACLCVLASTAALRAQTIGDAMTQLKNHVLGTAPLTASQIDGQTTVIRQNVSKLGSDSAVIAQALDLVTTFETKKGALFTVAPTRGGYLRDANGFELPNAMLALEQGILDFTYTPNSLAQNEALLNGWKIGSSAFFPGSVAPPANSTATRPVLINASQPKITGSPPLYFDYDARRPTGSYLAPGSIATVTVPAALVNKGFKVRVGAHSWDLRAKDRIERHDRVSRVYPITSATTKVANPLGGGIYIEVPYLASGGIVTVQIANAVRSPFFSSTSFRTKTSIADWQNIERTQPGPWADFESDKFMMQVPRSWIYAFANPVPVLNSWDAAMDAVSDLMGRPRVMPKTVMYAQVDVILRANVNAPGYPMSNDPYEPYNPANGNKSHYLLTGPKGSAWTVLHELGHGSSFTKFTGEVESAVNLLFVAVHNQKFGIPLDQAFGQSIGNEGTENVDRKNAALTWLLTKHFRTGDKRMTDAEMRYEHRGHGKYVEIAGLYGWEALNDFWKSVNDDYDRGIDYPENTDPTDSRILRMSKAAGVDLRPLFHLWGVPPLNAATLRTSIAAAGLQPSGLIYDWLKFYQNAVPMTLTQYRNHYYTVKSAGPDGEAEALFDSYTPAIGDSAKAAIQSILDTYFPSGNPDLLNASWDVIPGNGSVDPGNGIWSAAAANWTPDLGATNAGWSNGNDATFGPGSYTVDIATGNTVRNLTVAPGGGSVIVKGINDGTGLTVSGSPTWNMNDSSLTLLANISNDTKLIMAAGQTLTVKGSGTFNTGEKPFGADWNVPGCNLYAQGPLTLRGHYLSVGKFANVRLQAGGAYIHERNSVETYPNAWELAGSGQVRFGNRVARNFTLAGVVSGTAGIIVGDLGVQAGVPQWLMLDNPLNTFTGRTTLLTGGILVIANGDERSLGNNPATFAANQLELDGGTLQQSNTAALVIDDSRRGVTLSSDGGTFTASGTLTLATPVTGPGSLTAAGGTIVLGNAANSYTGDTAVTAGTLRVNSPTLADAAAVRLTGGGLLHLAFSGTDTVQALVIDGVYQPGGTWGAPGSAAENTSPRILGSGLLRVSKTAYDAWARQAGLDGSPGREADFYEDPDSDGIANGIEWILGLAPRGGSGLGYQLAATADPLTFSFSRVDASESSTTLHLQWGDGLGLWNDVLIGPASRPADGDGVAVEVAENGEAADTVVVSLPARLAVGGKIFVRLKAGLN